MSNILDYGVSLNQYNNKSIEKGTNVCYNKQREEGLIRYLLEVYMVLVNLISQKW